MDIVNRIAPEKFRKIASDDKPWFTEPLKNLDRKRRREFNKNRRSEKYFRLHKQFKSKCLKSKKKFFNDMVNQAKEADPSRLHSMLKRISEFDKDKLEDLVVEDIKHMTDEEQAEAIADNFNKISKEYKEIHTDDIKIPIIAEGSIPSFSPRQIKKYLEKVKTNKATLPGDIPAQIVKTNSEALSVPFAHMINYSKKSGSWPDSYKHEIITPVGKVRPVEHLDQLRPISNLPIMDKIQEAVISDLIVSDMKEKMNPTQYGDQKKTIIQHYLLKLMNRILTNVDRNSRK